MIRAGLLRVPRQYPARGLHPVRRRLLPAARERPVDDRLRHRQRLARDVGAEPRLLAQRRRVRAEAISTTSAAPAAIARWRRPWCRLGAFRSKFGNLQAEQITELALAFSRSRSSSCTSTSPTIEGLVTEVGGALIVRNASDSLKRAASSLRPSFRYHLDPLANAGSRSSRNRSSSGVRCETRLAPSCVGPYTSADLLATMRSMIGDRPMATILQRGLPPTGENFSRHPSQPADGRKSRHRVLRRARHQRRPHWMRAKGAIPYAYTANLGQPDET